MSSGGTSFRSRTKDTFRVGIRFARRTLFPHSRRSGFKYGEVNGKPCYVKEADLRVKGCKGSIETYTLSGELLFPDVVPGHLDGVRDLSPRGPTPTTILN